MGILRRGPLLAAFPAALGVPAHADHHGQPRSEESTSEGGVPIPKEVSSGSTGSPPERLFTADLAWDKQNTHTDDLDSFFPIHRLQEYAEAGRIGGLAARYHGAPTEYSQRRTLEQDAPEILRRCREDGVEAALLVPL